ncbi:membrane assembly protein AsmA [Thioalkalivibrio denitrificans]|uniref:Membrane assembly protein AsmA n=1 Tax=Thioalkalivibrio denitrificans TaxID=108003 RepID=A0A1V3NLP2_9GAMM|nr:AsmA family protein [Thioalkalivibrio denitrificans]OOG25971.1 membrane assembly protein AsmA [Thioalkalivibrio denitrificans]
MKWFKRVLILLLALLILAGATAAYLVATFDPNEHKDRISAAVKEQTGRDLVIEGEIGLTLFPRLGVSLGDTWLSNAEGFTDEPFARIREVELSVALMPLLRRELQVEQIRLVGLALNLERDAQGRTNWDDLVEAAETPDEPVEPRLERVPGEAPALRDIDVGGLVIRDASVSWRDEQAGTALRLDPFNMELGRIRLGEPTPLEMSLRLHQEEPAMTAEMDLNARLTIDLEAQRYDLRRLVAAVDLSGEELPADLSARIRADVGADLAAGTAAIDDLSVETLGLTLSGRMAVRGLDADNPRVSGELSSDTFSVRTLLRELGEEPPETADPDVLENVSVELAFEADADAASLTSLAVRLDDTRLTGNARVSQYDSPAIRAELDVDRINLDRYLPPPADEPVAPPRDAPEAEREGWPDDPIELPVEMLRSLNVNAGLAVGEMIINGLTLTQLSLTLSARDGLVELKPFSGRLYEGSIEAAMSLDVRGDTPRYAFEQQLRGVRMGPLLDDMSEDGEGLLAGTTRLNARINTRGQSVKDLVSALNGSGDFEFADGAVKGINIAQIIRDAEARLRGQSVERTDEPNQTDFSELRGSFTIRDGIVTNEDLSASSPLLRVRGQGNADLPRERLDYRVNATLVATLEGQSGRSLDELRGVNLPIRIRGPFSDPSVSLDLASVMEGRAREEAERRLREEVTPRIEEQREGLEEQLRDRLRIPGLR